MLDTELYFTEFKKKTNAQCEFADFARAFKEEVQFQRDTFGEQADNCTLEHRALNAIVTAYANEREFNAELSWANIVWLLSRHRHSIVWAVCVARIKK